MKIRFSFAAAIATLVASLGLLVSGLPAQDRSFKDRIVTDRTNQNLEATEAVRKGFDTFGRRWGDTNRPAPASPAPAIPAPIPNGSTAEIRYGLVHLVKTVPAQVALGETYSYDIVATAVDDAGNIIITDTIPEGATYVKSEPTASREGDTLTWKYPSMHRGETKNHKVWLRADREGDLVGCATVIAVPRKCVTTVVGRAVLEIVKTGPETAIVGSDVTYKVIVSNKGNQIAKDVELSDLVPDGLTHGSGEKSVGVKVGDLAPKDSRAFSLTLRAAKRGRVVNTVAATSSNAEKVSASAPTLIVQPGLKVEKTGDKEQILNRRATYTVAVSNTGDTPLNGVIVTDTAPAETTIVSADGASIVGNVATWRVASLRAGEQQKFIVVLTARSAGVYANSVSVRTDEGLIQTAEAATTWRGVSGLHLEKKDDPDPIQVGETTTYTVRVVNQGTADDTNVGVTVVFPKELVPTSATGGRIDGLTVTFPAVARLAAKQEVTYIIKAKGVEIGDARVKFIMTSGNLTSPVNAEESTRVY